MGNVLLIIFSQVVEMDHGMKSKNPFTKIYFYNKEDTKNAGRINAHQVTVHLNF